MSEVTRILDRLQRGDPGAADDLLPRVYDELRRIAAAKMAAEAPGQTLQPTALVHEAWLRLGGDAQPHWQGRAHFFAAAAEAMRRILVENARRKGRLKRGGDAAIGPLDTAALEISAGAPDEEVLAVHEALGQLAAEDPQAAEVVKLRYFIGLPLPEVAGVLGVSPRTADRLWAYARARLKQLIRGGAG
jgi:RNA polymerase sigma factor (TIGR02999 family)